MGVTKVDRNELGRTLPLTLDPLPQRPVKVEQGGPGGWEGGRARDRTLRLCIHGVVPGTPETEDPHRRPPKRPPTPSRPSTVVSDTDTPFVPDRYRELISGVDGGSGARGELRGEGRI